MAHNLGTEENPNYVNVRINGSQVDIFLRTNTKEDLETDLLIVGLKYKVKEKVIDPDTGNISYVETGEIKTRKGVTIYSLEGITLFPAEYDNDGNLISEAIVDDRIFTNIRLTKEITTLLDEEGNNIIKGWLLDWMHYGYTNFENNKNETGVELFGTTLLDPDSIKSPRVTWC